MFGKRGGKFVGLTPLSFFGDDCALCLKPFFFSPPLFALFVQYALLFYLFFLHILHLTYSFHFTMSCFIDVASVP